MNFDSEDYHRAYGSDCISYHQRPVCGHTALYDKEYRAERKHYEGCERYAAGIARADSRDGLRQIAEYHTYGGTVAEDVCPEFVHSFYVWQSDAGGAVTTVATPLGQNGFYVSANV